MPFFSLWRRISRKANEIFREIAEKDSVSPIALRFYAVSLFEAGDYQQSRNIFEQYFAKVPPLEIEAADYGYYGKAIAETKRRFTCTLKLPKKPFT